MTIWVPGLLALLVVTSALAVVWSKHESRYQFVELQRLQSRGDDMNVEWGQLQLEEGTWATHGRVEKFARERLGMLIPPAADVVIIRR